MAVAVKKDPSGREVDVKQLGKGDYFGGTHSAGLAVLS